MTLQGDWAQLTMAPASVVAPVDKLGVLIAVLLAAPVLGEVFSWKLALGAALIVVGTLVIASI